MLSTAAADNNLVDPLLLTSITPAPLPPKPASGDVEGLSEWVFECLVSRKALLVIDHVEQLLKQDGGR